MEKVFHASRIQVNSKELSHYNLPQCAQPAQWSSQLLTQQKLLN